jgi:hypothetical protein
MKMKVYNKKVIDFVLENMMTPSFVADGPNGSTRQKKNLGHHIFPYKNL